jgi:hypothetical protein
MGGLLKKWWKGQDSNLRTRKRADLQSAAINHSATLPYFLKNWWTQKREEKKREKHSQVKSK